MIFQLTYELKDTDRDYSEFYKYLDDGISGGDSVHVLRDTWWIACQDEVTVNSLCDSAKSYLGDNDLFFVTRIDENSINGWLPSSYWNWFRNNK